MMNGMGRTTVSRGNLAVRAPATMGVDGCSLRPPPPGMKDLPLL